MDPKDYEGREQAYVKHWVLERYLQVLALKIGQFRSGTTLNYIDGFSGPFDHGAPLDSDQPTSPNVALRKLRDAREQLRSMGKHLTIRGMFVESDPGAYQRLQNLLRRWSDIETASYYGAFEDYIAEAVQFAESGRAPFSFIFIDPTGWTGYGLKAIAPLLRVEPGEVLINFMLKDIRRFIDDEGSSARGSFDVLFAQDSEVYRSRWRGLTGRDREDAIVAAYCERIREVGRFSHCGSTIVFDPQDDRTHYHLIYATRSRKGLIAFREIERGALRVQKEVRATAKESRRVDRTSQFGLFDPSTMDTPYLETLRGRYRDLARADLLTELGPCGSEISYEMAVDCGLRRPMVSERDVKDLLAVLQREGRIEFVGLGEGKWRPKLGGDHRIRRIRD